MIIGKLDQVVKKDDCANDVHPHIAKARALYEQTKKGADLKTAASELSIDREWARKLLPLAFASPSVIERALKGDLPARATAGWFAKTNLPGDFSEQRRLIDGLA